MPSCHNMEPREYISNGFHQLGSQPMYWMHHQTNITTARTGSRMAAPQLKRLPMCRLVLG